MSCSGKLLIGSVFVVAILGLAAGGQGAAKVEGDTIVLGATLSFSGTYSSEGFETYNGYELAVERINAAGSVTVDGKTYKLRIMYYDDESSPTIAKTLPTA